MKKLKNKKLLMILAGIVFLAVIIALVLFYNSKNSQSSDSFIPVSTTDITNFISTATLPPASESIEREEIEEDGYRVMAAKEGNIDSPVTFSVGEGKVSFTSIGNSNLGKMNNSELIVGEDGKITYENIFNGINLIYTPSKDKILEEYEIRAKRKIEYLVQKIDVEGLRYEKKDDGSIIFTDSTTSKFAFAVPQPVMYEKYNTKEKSFGLHYEIIENAGNTYLAKVIDEDGAKWLSERANYPVMIDATILLTLFSYTSYPTVDGTWQIDAQTVGKGDLSINTNGLGGLTLSCDNKNIEYQTSSSGEAIFPNFSCDGNIIIKTSVNDPTKQNTLDISYSGFATNVSSIVDTGKPIIISSSLTPPVVAVGEVITLSIEAASLKGIQSVSADMGGIETISLSLKEGTGANGSWQGEWTVHDTATKPYEVLISVKDSEGEITKSSIGFFDPYTCTGGGDHAGMDWNPVDDVTCTGDEIAGEHTNIGIFSVNNGQTAIVKAFDQINQYGIATISASVATIAGTINASGKGWVGGYATANGLGPGGGTGSGNIGAGAGFGGVGSNGTGAGGSSYGSLATPGDLGSGGGGSENSGSWTGGSGGGAIRINTTGTLTIDGTISSNGLTGNRTAAGAGSGGSIYLYSPALTGSGSISANGGSSGGAGGGGGGGRIAIYYTNTNSYNGTITASLGTGGSGGSNGTAFVKADSTGDILIPSSNGIWYASDLSSWTFRNLVINGNITFQPQTSTLLTITSTGSSTFASGITVNLGGSYTTDSDGVGVYFNLTGDVTIPTTTTISANSRGYAGGNFSHNNGYGPGPGIGSGNGGAGGGHGGIGANAPGATGGGLYGSLISSGDLGSGGGWSGNSGSWNGGAGGGAIKITTTGTLTVSGTISSNGSVGSHTVAGAGSGGGIYLDVVNLAGSGSITANGGSSGGTGGGGAGGRITVYYSNSNSFSGSVTSSAGTGGSTGATYGTAFIKNNSTGDLLLPSNNYIWYKSDISNWTFHDITINGNAYFWPDNASLLTITATGAATFASGITVNLGGSYTTDSDGVGVYFNLTGDVTIPTTTTISANSRGYAGGNSSHNNGYGPGPGIGNGNTGGGGGFGGKGNNAVGAGGNIYGLSTAPIELGSGGGWSGNSGSWNGGAGGGAIKITTTGTFRINGTITSNGSTGSSSNAGAGSGGSIYINMRELQGAGTIQATGANSGGNGGGGGGGRISLTCSEGGNWLGNNLASSSATAKGTGGTGGGNGTVHTDNCYVVNKKVGGNTRVDGNVRMR